MLSRRPKTSANASLEHVLLLSLIGVLGAGGFAALGRVSDDAIRGRARGVAAIGASADGAPAPTVGPSAMAGLVSAVREASTAAKGWVREVPARLSKAKEAYVETRRLITPTKTVPWDELKPEYAERAAEVAIRRAERNYWRIKSRLVPKTVKGALTGLERAEADLEHLVLTVGHLQSVSDDAALGDAYRRLVELTSTFGTKVKNDRGLWAAIKRFEGARGAKRLEGEEARVLGQQMDAWRRGGADLAPDVRARLGEIDEELSKLSTRFGDNLVAANKGFEVRVDDVAQLEGMLPEHIELARASAERAGQPGYRLSLADGTAGQAMARAHSEALRTTIWENLDPIARSGETNNLPLVQRTLELRREKAELLGFADYADLTTVTRMVKNGERAEAFVDDLAEKTRAAAQAEFDELRVFRKSIDGKDTFERWDGAYWSRKFDESKLDLDALREYFTVDGALDAFRTTVEELYGVRLEEANFAVWHPDVRSFRLLDEDGRLLGTVQLDLVSREGKRPGAWQRTVSAGVGDEPATTVIVANLPQPTPGKPSLIGVSGAETIFHELGHAFHAMLSEARMKSLAGTSVAWDFVELPSQLMENFVWDDKVFDVLARHWQTGERMPEDLKRALYATRTDGAASAKYGYTASAKLDLGLHRGYRGSSVEELEAFAERLLADHVLEGSKARPWRSMPQFKHVFSGGYAAGYYSYAWAEVLDADAFSRFQADGTLSRRVGEEFRRTLLSRGDTADPDELFRNFMGRDPDPSALLRRMGLDPDKAPAR